MTCHKKKKTRYFRPIWMPFRGIPQPKFGGLNASPVKNHFLNGDKNIHHRHNSNNNNQATKRHSKVLTGGRRWSA